MYSIENFSARLTFGLLMKLRKDLWVMVGFHFFVNMWMAYGT